MPRATPYAKKTQALRKKASELAILCDVKVALVCAAGDGAGAEAPLMWESDEGVLDRYRGAAVKPDARARHTHRSYLEAELGKERAKLARARPRALADWDPALNDMTPDEAREVLETIDAALRAAGDRMVALGLPTDGEQVGGEQTVPQQLGLDGMEDARFQMQMVPCQGGNNDGGLLEQLPRDGRFPMQPGYGLESCVGSNYDVGAVDETQAPASYGHNADCGWPDMTMWYANDESCLPAGYYDPKFTLAPEHYSAQVVTGGGHIDMLPLQNPIGMDENFTNLDNSYRAQWPAQEYQRSGTNSSMEENYSYDDESCLPAGYYDPKLVDDTRAPEHYSAQVVTAGGYIDTLPLQYPMGMDGNFSYVDNSYWAQWPAEEFHRSDTNSSVDENYAYMVNSYAAHWRAEEFQCPDTGPGQFQNQWSDPGTSSSSQVFHHRY